MQLTEEQSQLICTCLEYVVRAKREHARTMRQCTRAGGNAMLSADAAAHMGEEHQRDADEIERLITLIGECPVFSVENS